ncbi:hypothetical protein [Curtobacterium ammoniigenes]|uniref:hypothetical protein n=1 Tax=Curtobacterium ammoniigenes TaxID=395387 RepID=UPI000836A13F|nr:hypothetical protein [Curtobacterium ammoniigenes]
MSQSLLPAEYVESAAKRALAILTADRSGGAGRLVDEPHRTLMRDAKVLLSLVVSGGGGEALRASELIAAAQRRVDALRSLQSSSGLFIGGDNLQSPPDSAFTINDVCDTLAFLPRVGQHGGGRGDEGGGDDPGASNPNAGNAVAIEPVRAVLERIVRDATDALLHGGIHTPNHRWEISAALARIHYLSPDPRLVDRVDEWLAEGVDVDNDGIYSERSPNYAAHVTNPSLTALARILERPALDAVVERNLDVTLALIRPDDTVETLQSRRQDQRERFPLAAYAGAYRIAAVRTGRADFAAIARRAAASAPTDPELLAAALLEPALCAPLPADQSVDRESLPAFAESGETLDAPDDRLASIAVVPSIQMAVHRSDHVEAVLYAGSDYAQAGRIRSGLANNPTFARLFAGEVRLDSIRLSRSFFDMGPFRPSSLERTGTDRFVLTETVRAAYYQPLAPEHRDPDGAYALVDDGRFSAAMAFPLRKQDVVTMRTRVEARLLPDGMDLDVELDAPRLGWSLEFAFAPGGELVGGLRADDGTWILPSGAGEYRVGTTALGIRVSGAALSDDPMPYEPGQDYTFLGGTDAADGVRVRVGGTAPTRFRVALRATRG